MSGTLYIQLESGNNSRQVRYRFTEVLTSHTAHALKRSPAPFRSGTGLRSQAMWLIGRSQRPRFHISNQPLRAW
jgi:hypothetical protein